LSAAELEEALQLSLLAAFPDRVARKRSLGSSVSRGNPVKAATQPQTELVFSSGGSAMVTDSALVVSHEYFVAVDVEERKHLGQARSQVQVRSLCAIEPEWLFDIPGGAVQEVEEMTWDPQRGRVEAHYRMSYDQLVLDESRGRPKDATAAARRLAQAIREALADPERSGPALSEWVKREELDELLRRAALVREHYPTAGVPDWTPAGIQASLEAACEGKASLSDLGAASAAEFLTASLDYAVAQKLDRLAPSHAELLKGRRVKIHYDAGKPPWVESRLQDFFGMTVSPSILEGRLPLTVHLLAPNQRAVQVTSDLPGFWTRIYPELRRELGRKYPRHAWPEDPLSAEAIAMATIKGRRQ
jgi:ATP-dependent helicase HrpB